MENIIAKIRQAEASHINEILDCAVKRYQELFPDWDITTIVLEKKGNRNEQISRIIATLETIKKEEIERTPTI